MKPSFVLLSRAACIAGILALSAAAECGATKLAEEFTDQMELKTSIKRLDGGADTISVRFIDDTLQVPPAYYPRARRAVLCAYENDRAVDTRYRYQTDVMEVTISADYPGLGFADPFIDKFRDLAMQYHCNYVRNMKVHRYGKQFTQDAVGKIARITAVLGFGATYEQMLRLRLTILQKKRDELYNSCRQSCAAYISTATFTEKHLQEYLPVKYEEYQKLMRDIAVTKKALSFEQARMKKDEPPAERTLVPAKPAGKKRDDYLKPGSSQQNQRGSLGANEGRPARW